MLRGLGNDRVQTLESLDRKRTVKCHSSKSAPLDSNASRLMLTNCLQTLIKNFAFMHS
jgi:hypothetical protein